VSASTRDRRARSVCNVTAGVAARSSMDKEVRAALESDIRMTHERFCAAMEARLPALDADTVERYFALLSSLVEKLEDPDRELRQILQDMMGEAAGLIMQEMQKARSR
jgi:hypothetical protein